MVGGRVPFDVILEILVWLPVKSILRFKCVCKEWYNIINTPLFAKLQVNKSLEPDSRQNRILFCTRTLSMIDDLYDPLKWTKLNWPNDTIKENDSKHLVGSCNGLVCIKVSWKFDDTDIYGYTVRCFLVCNPTTRTFKLILPCSETKWGNHYLSYGFVYDIEHDDYKIIASSYVLKENDRHVYIYSLKTDLWSWSYPPTRSLVGKIKSRGIFGNNMLHYLVSPNILSSTVNLRIVRFDIVSEKWRDDLSLPVPVQVNHFVRFGKLDGWLYLQVGDHSVISSDVWMMEEYGSWKKMFHFPQVVYRPCSIIARSKKGCHSLLLQNNCDFRNELFWYDQRDKTRKPFKLKKFPWEGRSFMLCIASLVAIPGCSLTKLQEVKDGA